MSHHPQVQRFDDIIRSRSQHERINSAVYRKPVWHSTIDAKAIRINLTPKASSSAGRRPTSAQNPSPETVVIAAYLSRLINWFAEKGYQSWTSSACADNPQSCCGKSSLNGHTHGEDGVRFRRGVACFACTLATRCPGAAKKNDLIFGSRPHSALV